MKKKELLKKFIVKTHVLHKKYVNTLFKRVLFNFGFMCLIAMEYAITIKLSLPYLYLFRLLKIFIALTCIIPSILIYTSPSFEYDWAILEKKYG